MKQKSGFMKRVDKFFHELSKSFTMVIQPLSSRLIKPNFSLIKGAFIIYPEGGL